MEGPQRISGHLKPATQPTGLVRAKAVGLELCAALASPPDPCCCLPPHLFAVILKMTKSFHAAIYLPNKIISSLRTGPDSLPLLPAVSQGPPVRGLGGAHGYRRPGLVPGRPGDGHGTVLVAEELEATCTVCVVDAPSRELARSPSMAPCRSSV